MNRLAEMQTALAIPNVVQERRVWTVTEDEEIFNLVQKHGTRQWCVGRQNAFA
jgi:hypothetical protein